jgi:HAD superfamily hydrolase (TIGR01509 family)
VSAGATERDALADLLGRVRAVIFDNDGVLVDSEHISIIAYRRAVEEQGVALREEDNEKYCGLTDQDIIRDMEKVYGRGLDLARFQERKRELYFELAAVEPMPAFAGARELVRDLVERGIPVALASSGSAEKIAFNLGRAGLQGIIPVIVTGEDFHRGKPDPEIFLCAAEKLGIEPAECAVIEDSINGLLAARAAGMTAVAVTNTFPANRVAEYADVIVKGLDELVGRMGSAQGD